jgi:hypothetical protein
MYMGRPKKIKSPEEFTRRAEKYFEGCKKLGERPILTGLCMALGLCSRQELMDYQHYPEYTDSVRAAKLYVESCYERKLGADGGAQAGVIFALKNFGWSDQQKVEISGPDQGPVEVITGEMTDEALKRARRIAAAALGAKEAQNSY